MPTPPEIASPAGRQDPPLPPATSLAATGTGGRCRRQRQMTAWPSAHLPGATAELARRICQARLRGLDRPQAVCYFLATREKFLRRVDATSPRVELREELHRG